MRVITISRMFGAGGSEVAARVAEALGWTLLDNALVERVASELGATREEVAAREERPPSLAERLADSLALGTPEVVPATMHGDLPFTEERMLQVTRHVVEEAVASGPVVLVGRGAQSCLAAREGVLHVFCVAPPDALARRIAAREEISIEAAARRVEEVNAQRERYVRRHWHRSWLGPSNYHLCVNTAWLGIEGAAELVVAAARERLGDAG